MDTLGHSDLTRFNDELEQFAIEENNFYIAPQVYIYIDKGFRLTVERRIFPLLEHIVDTTHEHIRQQGPRSSSRF